MKKFKEFLEESLSQEKVRNYVIDYLEKKAITVNKESLFDIVKKKYPQIEEFEFEALWKILINKGYILPINSTEYELLSLPEE